MRALITGVTGFVGRHLAQHLISLGYEVWGTTRQQILNCEEPELHLITMNINDEAGIIEILNQIKPNHIYHLAGQSSVKLSWESIQHTFEANVANTISLLEAIRKSSVSESVKVLTVGSSEEYGKALASDMPINETVPLKPISPYGLSKATVCMLAQQYSDVYKVQVVHARPFNHIGPGQGLGFVTADFAFQIAQIEADLIQPAISVGNLDAQRDFSDVKDIVSAYEKLLNYGSKGEAYNVCSGTPVAIKEILMRYINFSSRKDIKVIEDVARMRPSDLPLCVGDSSKIKSVSNWENQTNLDQSLMDILNYWRAEIKSSKESSINV